MEVGGPFARPSALRCIRRLKDEFEGHRAAFEELAGTHSHGSDVRCLLRLNPFGTDAHVTGDNRL